MQTCFECGNKSEEWKFRKHTRLYVGEGYKFELEVETPFCEKCGSPIYDREIEQEIREKAHKMILIQRRKYIEQIRTYDFANFPVIKIERNRAGRA